MPASATRKLDLTKGSRKFIASLAAKQQQQIVAAIDALAENPKPQDSRLLTMGTGLFRKDAGEYRIAYRFDDAVIYIELIGKRNDDQIYRDLKRKKPR